MKEGGLPIGNPPSNLSLNSKNYFLFKARSIATAIATVAPTIGLLPTKFFRLIIYFTMSCNVQ